MEPDGQASSLEWEGHFGRLTHYQVDCYSRRVCFSVADMAVGRLGLRAGFAQQIELDELDFATNAAAIAVDVISCCYWVVQIVCMDVHCCLVVELDYYTEVPKPARSIATRDFDCHDGRLKHCSYGGLPIQLAIMSIGYGDACPAYFTNWCWNFAAGACLSCYQHFLDCWLWHLHHHLEHVAALLAQAHCFRLAVAGGCFVAFGGTAQRAMGIPPRGA